MEDPVPFEIAKKLKEKSFPQKTAGRYSMIDCFYYEDGKLFLHGGACDVNEAYTAPTISQVLKWLRDEKKLYIMILNWDFIIVDLNTADIIFESLAKYSSYEETAIEGIKYVLNNII